MTSRERWIIYPLLFLALGAALRDKMVPGNLDALTIECAHLKCHSLDVVRPEGGDGIRMGTVTTGAGQIEIYNADQEQIVRIGPDGSGNRGRVETGTPGNLGGLNPVVLQAIVQRELGRVFESMLQGPGASATDEDAPSDDEP